MNNGSLLQKRLPCFAAKILSAHYKSSLLVELSEAEKKFAYTNTNDKHSGGQLAFWMKIRERPCLSSCKSSQKALADYSQYINLHARNLRTRILKISNAISNFSPVLVC